MVLLVFVATYILVFSAYGYNIDTKTGEVIQDGLIYIDSAPDGARITINGKLQDSKTNTRISLPEGKYTLEISKDGYQAWERSFMLEGGEVLRYTYPLLFPTKLETAQIKSFDAPIQFATQSPDRRWIVLSGQNVTAMTLFDLRNRDNNDQPLSTVLNFPASLFTTAKGAHRLKLVEWSTDNRHLLVRHSYAGGREFIMLDIDQPAQSYNVGAVLKQKPDKVNLFDKKFDKLYVYSAKTKILSVADVKSKVVSTFATDVISYKPHGSDTVLMSKASAEHKDRAEIIMRQKARDYLIKLIPLSDSIPPDIARYSGDWYIVIGVQKERRSYVYRNPVDFVTNKDIDPDVVNATVLRNDGLIDEVSFSQNARFIMSNSGRNFSIYDAETERHYSYTLQQKIDTDEPPAWMDGHRIMVNSGGKLLVFDYDGINRRALLKVDPALPVMFDRDYIELYSLAGLAKGKYGLSLTQLRIPADR